MCVTFWLLSQQVTKLYFNLVETPNMSSWNKLMQNINYTVTGWNKLILTTSKAT